MSMALRVSMLLRVSMALQATGSQDEARKGKTLPTEPS